MNTIWPSITNADVIIVALSYLPGFGNNRFTVSDRIITICQMNYDPVSNNYMKEDKNTAH